MPTVAHVRSQGYYPYADGAFHTGSFDPKPKLVTLCVKLIKIGAKVVRHGRYVTFQLAEVAIPRHLFAEILRRIDELRPAPLPP